MVHSSVFRVDVEPNLAGEYHVSSSAELGSLAALYASSSVSSGTSSSCQVLIGLSVSSTGSAAMAAVSSAAFHSSPAALSSTV